MKGIDDKQYVLNGLAAKESWRLFKIMAEFVEGFEELPKVYPAITVFGSNRVRPGHPYYQKAEEIARLLAKEGFSVITGGGPGIMEAANKGAAEAGAYSVGLNIRLPREQQANPYANIKLEFRYFFVRKVMMAKYAVGLMCLPGGFGTLDEFFEIVTLVQTHKIRPVPIVLVESKFWEGLVDWMKKRLLHEGMISKEDLDLFTVLDDPREIAKFFKETARGYKLLSRLEST
ncbi:LOG family protein [Thermodesulfatator atlanticus]|uniref:LOG family protein n=1 Tax=Thermodesulfatator atlanticus TaxID=501497 RepID=UPI0003B5D4B4|nr:TIGR00730 family Rossman fold protein [Thermodesulfatator atlanticus]